MACDKPWFDHLVDRTGDCFCWGLVLGSAYDMLKGMRNSLKGERLIWGSQAVRMSATGASCCAAYGGLSSVFKSSMIYVRQKDDPWNSILPEAAASGFLKIAKALARLHARLSFLAWEWH
ncbi:unnamed protein product [Fraxinus pennsylvanica]|uniref:Mitochondrial import inner membrane translocase subunit n=1 Tax=Fraxinus pennsylvanica TaxID=56036 RepID=A0AAD2A4D9_9LAMI|nr:unnamed protein product [Fraxinus pennsylvanica]